MHIENSNKNKKNKNKYIFPIFYEIFIKVFKLKIHFGHFYKKVNEKRAIFL